MATDKTPATEPAAEAKKTGFPPVLQSPKDLPTGGDAAAASAIAEATATPAAGDADLKDAVEFLKTEVNVPEAALESMAPEAVMSWATEVAAGETTDPTAQGASDTESEIAGILARLNAPGAPAREAPAPPATPGDAATAVEYGEVGAKEFAAMKSRMQTIEDNASALGQMYGARVIKDGVARHREAYPSLKTPVVLAKVEEIATNLVQTGTYRDMDKAFDDAVLLAFRGKPEKTKEASDLRKKVAALKANSQPTKPGRQEPVKAMESGDLTDRIGKALVSGDREGAKKLSVKAGLYHGG